jgi:hypothetical protein
VTEFDEEVQVPGASQLATELRLDLNVLGRQQVRASQAWRKCDAIPSEGREPDGAVVQLSIEIRLTHMMFNFVNFF